MKTANTPVLLNGWVNALFQAIAFCLLVVGVASAQQNSANTNPAPVENAPSRHKIAFAKITGTVGESEKTAGCVIVLLASEPSTKSIYCRYELEKDTNFLRDDDNGINPDKVVNLYSFQDQNDFEQRIQTWFKNKLQLNLAPNELQLIAKLMISSTTFSPNSLFAIQPPARYDFVLPDSLPASDKTNAEEKRVEDYKTFAAEVHRFIPEKMAEIAENIPNNPVPITESTPNFKIAFAKASDTVDKPEKTAGCVIVLLASEPSTKHIYCRYELEKGTNFLRDDDNGINPDKVVILYSSQDQNDFEQRIQAWFKNKLQLNLAPNELQLIAKLMMSSTEKTFSPNSLFAIQPPARYEFVLPYTIPASDKRNAEDKKFEEYKTFAASVHRFIPKKMAGIADHPALTKNTPSRLEIAFAKVLGTVRDSGETASCVIVSSTGASSDQNVYCRYKYPTEGAFFDSEDGLNLSVVKSDSVPNIQKHFIDWFTTKYPQHHHLMINDVNEILAFMSNEAQEFPKDKTLFGKKPETILLTKLDSLTPPSHRNDLKNAHQNQFAWLVHQTIGRMIVPNRNETPAKIPPTDNNLIKSENNAIIWLGLGIVVIVILALLSLLLLAKKKPHLVTELRKKISSTLNEKTKRRNDIPSAPNDKTKLGNEISSAPDSSQPQKPQIDYNETAALRQDFDKLREELKNARLEHRKLIQQILDV